MEEEKIFQHTKECAYDGFGNELHVDDEVVFAVSRWTGDYILYKGKVVGWTEKMVKILGTDGATNSDKPAGMEYTKIIGRVANRKPDKIYKLNNSVSTPENHPERFIDMHDEVY